MNYNYNTPEQAILSLERAYSNKDLKNIIASKDFETEAKLILNKNSMPLSKEIILELAEILKLSLIENLQTEGFPNFESVKRDFSQLEEIDRNLFIINETLNYSKEEIYINKIFLSKKDDKWRVVMTDRITDNG